MACTSCASSNQTGFPAEVGIHFPDLRDVDKRQVLVFPKVQVCLDCGCSSFMTPVPELKRLRTAKEPLA